MLRAMLLLMLVGVPLVATAPVAVAETSPAVPAESSAPATAEDGDDLPKNARVTYVTSSIVYIDAGTRDGLEVGDIVELVHGGAVVPVEVFEVSSHKAACRRPESRIAIDVGDTVRFHGRAAARPAASVAAPSRAAAKSRPEKQRDFAQRLRDLGFSGRIGARYQMTYQPSTDYGYHRPGLDLRLRGHEIAGSNFDTDVDIRAYRSFRDNDGDSAVDSAGRVYRANVAWNPESVPMRLVLGRQYSPALANLSLFDGGLLQYDSTRFSVGAIAGTQPSAKDYGYSTDIQQYGLWGEVHSLVGSERRWAGTLGLIGSYDGGSVNREYIYLQGRYDEKRGGLYVAQELDINRSWKKDSGESTISATSTNAFGRLRVTDTLALSAGVDNRRNVQLYRDHVTPETDFDDDYRTGWWVRSDWRYGWLRTGFDVRFSRGGSDGDVNAYTGHVGAANVTRLQLDLRSRTTWYDGSDAEGWLQSFTARAPIGQSVGVSLQGGLRDENSKIDNGIDTQLGWYGIDLDVMLGRHWLYLVSVERNEDDDSGSWQVYTALSWRF